VPAGRAVATAAEFREWSQSRAAAGLGGTGSMGERGSGKDAAVADFAEGSLLPVAVSGMRRRPVPSHPRVLVIDDDPLVRSMMVRALERHGFDVVSADGGRAAVTLFREQADTIDVVLLDLSMPEIGGEETFLALREIDPGARVVFSSGAALEGCSGGLPPGFAGFVQKPCLPSDLALVLWTVLHPGGP
jgi:CheY-like chemotaxis protein